MSIHISPSEAEDQVISRINTTPLVDVMLVLLIIFLIAIPVVTTSIAVTLPEQFVQEQKPQPESIVISVDEAGAIFWYDTPVADVAALVEKLKVVAASRRQPEIQIRGDMAGMYEGVGKVLYACQSAGIVNVSFITRPPANGD